jgi:hypothetical protein
VKLDLRALRVLRKSGKRLRTNYHFDVRAFLYRMIKVRASTMRGFIPDAEVQKQGMKVGLGLSSAG